VIHFVRNHERAVEADAADNGPTQRARLFGGPRACSSG
jgi:hypothetical protein